MFIWSMIRLSLQNLMISKLNSVLTMVGLLFGSAAFIATLSTIEGSKKQFEQQMKRMGTDLVWLKVTANTGPILNYQDLNFLKTFSEHISQTSLIHSSNGRVRFSGKESDVNIMGVNANYFELTQLGIAKGRIFSDEEVKKQEFKVLLGSDLAKNFFGESSGLGEHGYLLLNEKLFSIQIIGLVRRNGNELDNSVFLPEPLVSKLSAKTSIQTSAIVKVDSDKSTTQTRKLIKILLKTRLGDNFSAFDAESTIEATKKISDNFNLAGLVLALISLITGGVGIMNVMLLSVAQRKKEIGLRKALGAKGRIILLQFLLEAIFICVGGCLLGSGLGIYFGFLMAQQMNVQQSVSPQVLAIAFGFSIAIGLCFGMIPAVRASRLDPYEALRV